MSNTPEHEMTLDEYMRAWENADSRHQAVRDYNALRTRLASLEAENERLRPPAGHDGTTHWETCWQTHGHHACAIARVQRAEQRVAELERVVEAAKRLLRSECPEEGRIDTRPDPTCPRCTSGTTPDSINRGLCPMHGLVAALDGGEGREP